MKKFGVLIFSATALVAAGAASVRGYEAFVGLQQDECEFGTVSNKKYLEFLERAKVERKLNGVLLTNEKVAVQSKQFAEKNNIVFERLFGNLGSNNERIAAFHAMMRADGMLLRSITPDQEHPFGFGRSFVKYNYSRINLTGLLVLCYFGCFDDAFANFSLGHQSTSDEKANRISGVDIVFLPPDAISGHFYQREAPKYPRSCPVIPPST